jgi:hypothetical protein
LLASSALSLAEIQSSRFPAGRSAPVFEAILIPNKGGRHNPKVSSNCPFSTLLVLTTAQKAADKQQEFSLSS